MSEPVVFRFPAGFASSISVEMGVDHLSGVSSTCSIALSSGRGTQKGQILGKATGGRPCEPGVLTTLLRDVSVPPCSGCPRGTVPPGYLPAALALLVLPWLACVDADAAQQEEDHKQCYCREHNDVAADAFGSGTLGMAPFALFRCQRENRVACGRGLGVSVPRINQVAFSGKDSESRRFLRLSGGRKALLK